MRQTLSGVTVTDSKGATGCAVPSTMAVGYSQVCNYNRTAPNVSGSGTSADYVNIGTIDSAQTLPAVSDVTVTVEKPPAKLQVVKWESPFKEGDDGDGTRTSASSTTCRSPTAGRPRSHRRSVWFKVAVTNTGGQTATGLAISDSLRSFPVNADCPARPSTLAAGAVWICQYKVTFNSSSPATTSNTASATATNVAPDGDDSHTAIVRVSACTGTNRTVPNLIGLNKAQCAVRVDERRVHRDADRLERPAERDGRHPVPAGLHLRPAELDDDGDTMTRRRRRSRGQSLAEFAMVFPIFAIMLFGIIDFGRLIYTANTLGNSAREAARIGSVGNRPPECNGLTRDNCVKKIAQDRAWGSRRQRDHDERHVRTDLGDRRHHQPSQPRHVRPATCSGWRRKRHSPWSRR